MAARPRQIIELKAIEVGARVRRDVMSEQAFETVPRTEVVAQEVLRRSYKPLADKPIVRIVSSDRQRIKPFCCH